MTAPAGGGAAVAAPPADARLKALYSVMQSIENKLGGGEGVEGLYGSIKKSGMDKVLECLRSRCCLDSRSVLVDIGAGLGRPLMHALLEPGIAGARGIEIDRIKCDKAVAFLRQATLELQRRGVAGADALVLPQIECSPIEKVASLDPCTHAYSFWEGVPVEGKAAFGRLFAASRTLRSVAVVQRAIRTCPLEYMEDLGFGELVLEGSFSVSMSGSGRSFTAYVFNKATLPLALPVPLAAEQAAAHSVQTPAQAGEHAGAAASTGAVAAVAELEGESVQSMLEAAEAARAAAATSPQLSTNGRGRRQLKPSAKQAAAEEQQQAAQEEAEEQRRPSARERRADKRNAAAWEAAKVATPQQVAQAAAAEEQRPGTQQAAPQAGGSPSKATARAASAPRPAAAAAAKLSSPQKGGVQKRASPTKGASPTARSPQKAERGGAASRKLAVATAASKGSLDVEAAPLAAGSAGLLQRAARVIKSGMAEGVAKLRPTRHVAANRGLQTDRMAA